MRVLSGICAIVIAIASTPAASQGVGETIEFVNAEHRCVNVSNSAVSFWITSIHVEKRDGWLTETKAVGVQADVRLFSSMEGGPSFPRAKDISTVGIGGKIVRANLEFGVMSQYVFDAKTTRVDVPLTLLRTKGDNAVARYAKALIQFSKASSGVLPPNPYASGVQLVGSLADAFFQAVSNGNESSALKPNFQISSDLSRTVDCTPNQLKDGVHAKISDASASGIADVIPTADIRNYCFYLDGPESDRGIAYVAKPVAGTCSPSRPATARTLRNPQVVYAVWAVPFPVATALKAGADVAILAPALSAVQTERLIEIPEVARAREICRSIGVQLSTCLAPPRKE